MRRKDITPRVLAMILSAATLFSTVSTVAFANEDINTIQEVEEPQAQEEIEQTETAAEPEVIEQEAQESQPVETVSETQPASEETVPEPQPTPEPIPEPQPTQSEQEETPEVPATTQEETSETTAEEEPSEPTETEDEPTTQAEATEPEIVAPTEESEKDDPTFEKIKDTVVGGVNEAAKNIITTARDKVSDLFGNLVGALPGGEQLKAMFDFVTGLLGDEIIGNIWGDKGVDPVIEKLEEIQADIRKISATTIELKNATFLNAINTVNRISDQYIGRLVNYNKAVIELKKEPEGSDNIPALNKAVSDAKAEVIALASQTEISKELKDALAVSIQYMSNRTVGGENDNPFLINLEAKKASGSYQYGTELLAQQRQFDETVWKFFVEGLTLYTACMEINAFVAEDATDAIATAQNLAELLTGSTDGSESYIGNSVLNAIKIYHNEIRPAEDESIGQYQKKSTDAITTFKYLTNANISSDGKLTITDGTSYNNDAQMYITNFKSTSYKSYLNKLNKLINDEYLGNSDYESITLRNFITRKLGITVPEQSKYLLLSNIEFSYGNYVKAIPLDETQTSTQILRLNEQGCDNICFFTDSIASIENRAATVTYPGKPTFSFATFEEAWNFANNNQFAGDNVTIMMYQDVTANKNGDENFTRFAYGKNFASEENGRNVYGALVVNGNIIIDLNGHTINRNQDVPVAGGAVFMMRSRSSLTLKNGTITGGNTKANGGVVNSIEDHTDVTLENMTLTGNHADGYGGAVYYGYGIDYEMKDTTITNNTAGKGGGGIYCRSYQGMGTADIVVKGTIVIWDNTVNGKANNATLTDSGAKKTVFKLDKSFSRSSRIGVNSTTKDKWLDITNGCDLSKECKDCFVADRENQSLECYKGKVLRNWYICIWNNNKK